MLLTPARRVHPWPIRYIPYSFRSRIDTSDYLFGVRQVIGGAVAMGEAFDEQVLAKIGQISQAMRDLPDVKSLRLAVDWVRRCQRSAR